MNKHLSKYLTNTLKKVFNTDVLYPPSDYDDTRSAINKAYTIKQITKEEHDIFTSIDSIFEGSLPLRPGNQIIFQQSNSRKLGFTPKAFNINIVDGLFRGVDGFCRTGEEWFTYQWQVINCGYENEPILIGEPINGLKCETGSQTFTLDFPQVEISSWQRLQLVVKFDISAPSAVPGIVAIVFHSQPDINVGIN